ncbi:MAG: CrcB family protein [Dermatophilaceae bacterium]
MAEAATAAAARFLIDRAIRDRHGNVTRWGTFTPNMIGPFIIVAIVGRPWPGAPLPTGFCAAPTTYSTFSCAMLRLTEDGSLINRVLNVLGSVGAVVAATLLGGALAGGWIRV